ncbi:MAG: Crp/Fnr family transcriptional regulator, partial [Deltaproteobacteria bacterium]|nr:Crp/Fnr family transcriptional regulator [Deltaproteobacteria bacterium]
MDLARSAELSVVEDEALRAFRVHPFVASLELIDQEALLQRCSVSTLGAQRTLVRAGARADTVFFLVRGMVAVCHREGEKLGADVLVRLGKPPSIFGLAEVLSGDLYLEHVRSLTELTFVRVPADVMKRCTTLVRGGCGAESALLLQLSQDLLATSRRVRSMAFFGSRARLADLLLEYADLAGEAVPGGISIGLRLSQEELARNLSVTRQALS